MKESIRTLQSINTYLTKICCPQSCLHSDFYGSETSVL